MPPRPSRPPSNVSTVLGAGSILLWSTTVAFSRNLTEQLGVFTAGFLIYLIAGVLGVVLLVLRRRGVKRMVLLPRGYLFGCGAIFVLYTLLLYAAVGLSANRQQVVEVGLVNYLWPSFTLLFSVPVLGRKARFWLAPGMALALAGVVLSKVDVGFRWDVLVGNVRSNYLPYVLAFVGAMSWGLYSNLSRRWASRSGAGAVPLFMLVSSGGFLLLRMLHAETTAWSMPTAVQLVYMGVGPGLVAYMFWDVAMRRGRIILVASMSYAVPLIATTFSCLYLGVPMGWNLLAACALVIVGATVSKLSIHEGDRVLDPGSWKAVSDQTPSSSIEPLSVVSAVARTPHQAGRLSSLSADYRVLATDSSQDPRPKT